MLLGEGNFTERLEDPPGKTIMPGPVFILAAILDLVLVFGRKCILVLVTFSHFYPA